MEAVKFGNYRSDDSQRIVGNDAIIENHHPIDRNYIIRVITENVKNIVDALGDTVIYGISHDEIVRRGGILQVKDIKTHDTVELKLTVKIPVK